MELRGPALLIIGEVVAFAGIKLGAPGSTSHCRPTALSELRAATAGLCATLVESASPASPTPHSYRP